MGGLKHKTYISNKPKEPSLWFVVLPLPHRNKSQFSWVFRRETANGFYPWGKVYPWGKGEGLRKRVAEGLCGWRHGNSFPMTQSAQSHRQMWSIPHCPKAVFYVFVFDSIHNSATMHNLSPKIFTEPWFAPSASEMPHGASHKSLHLLCKRWGRGV